MAEKKSTSSAAPRKTARSALTQTNKEQRAPQAVSTADATIATARNAVIEGNASIDMEDVRRRAYELYEERGGEHGLHEDDWYRAEQEIRARGKNESSPQKKSA